MLALSADWSSATTVLDPEPVLSSITKGVLVLLHLADILTMPGTAGIRLVCRATVPPSSNAGITTGHAGLVRS